MKQSLNSNSAIAKIIQPWLKSNSAIAKTIKPWLNSNLAMAKIIQRRLKSIILTLIPRHRFTKKFLCFGLCMGNCGPISSISLILRRQWQWGKTPNWDHFLCRPSVCQILLLPTPHVTFVRCIKANMKSYKQLETAAIFFLRTYF